MATWFYSATKSPEMLQAFVTKQSLNYINWDLSQVPLKPEASLIKPHTFQAFKLFFLSKDITLSLIFQGPHPSTLFLYFRQSSSWGNYFFLPEQRQQYQTAGNFKVSSFMIEPKVANYCVFHNYVADECSGGAVSPVTLLQ